MIRRSAMVFLCLLAWGAARAAEIGVGATREAVIAALGEPAGRSSAGSREVLNYPAGRVFLRDGKVEELDAGLMPAEPAPPPAAPIVQAAAPKPAPAPVPAPVAQPTPPADHDWIKLSLITVFLCIILLLGRHWMRVAKRAQETRKADLLDR